MQKCKTLTRFLALFALLVMCLTGTVLTAHAEEEGPETPVTAEVYVKKQSKNNGYLYYTETNTRVTGQTGIKEIPAGSGKYYGFRDTNGRIYMRAAFKIGKKSYYADKNGLVVKGWKKFNTKKVCYYDPETFERSTGWKTIGKRTYFFSKKGALVTGLVKIGSNTYYLDPAKGGARTSGWKRINKKRRYFNEEGIMQTGLITVNGKTYYLTSAGVRKTGLRKYNGKTYFFSKTNGAMVTGWVTYKNKKYYMSTSASTKGQAVTGWMSVGSGKYYFDPSGAMHTGWLTLDGKKYYFDTSTGKMVTGKKTIDGQTYDFGTKGYITAPESMTPTRIQVNLSTCVVTIYSGNTPIKAMRCSPSANAGGTPTGTYPLGYKWGSTASPWHELFGNVWGRFCTTITGNILFHSVYYYSTNNHNLNTSAWNMLGSPASAGCIRLKCGDAYYIWKNCPSGTPVRIFWGSASDDPLGKPALTPISTNYDPTDPAITGQW